MVKNNSNKRAKKFKISRSHFGEKRKEVREMLKDTPGEGILSTFSLPGKNNDQENELQNIKIATNH